MRSLAHSMCQEWNLRHPPSVYPEDLLYFVYLDEFVGDWKLLYPDDDDEMSLWALEIAIMSDPEGPPVISNTGGLRKVRFSSTRQNAGKSGGNRICYAYFPEHHIVLMIMAYGKNRQENLSSAEKRGIRQYLAESKKWLDEHQ